VVLEREAVVFDVLHVVIPEKESDASARLSISD